MLVMEKQLELKGIALIGRTFEEYSRMFDLDESLLNDGTIIDVASGVSSFCAEAMAKGCSVIATDKIYSESPSEIERKSREDLESVIKQMPRVSDLYAWNSFKDIQSLKNQRERACKLFIGDFKRHGTARYMPVEYPCTNFGDGQFTLSLVSHFLFLYEDRLDYEFHKKTISELLRVTSTEIRIFPIVNLKGKISRMLGSLREDVDFRGVQFETKKVDYEFMRGETRCWS